MQSKLFFLLFFIFIFSLTFSSKDKKRKRSTQSNFLNPQEDYFQITFQPILPTTHNLQISDTIVPDLLNTQNVESSAVPSDLLNKLLDNKNVFRYIFAYLSLFELELNFKCTSTTLYDLYEKISREEKDLLKERLKNKTKFLENINCTRQYFDFFEKKHCSNPSRIEYVNVDYFSEDLVLFPKGIRQIICFTFEKIEYKYALFKNGHLSILKKLNKEEYFVFTSLEKDFWEWGFHKYGHNCKTEACISKIHYLQENGSWIEIDKTFSFSVGNFSRYYLLLHTTTGNEHNIRHRGRFIYI